MVSQSSRSDITTPNFKREQVSDEDVIRGFILALGAGGRKQKTLTIYEDSIRMLSVFARDLGLPGLTAMARTHIRHCLTSLHQDGNTRAAPQPLPFTGTKRHPHRTARQRRRLAGIALIGGGARD